MEPTPPRQDTSRQTEKRRRLGSELASLDRDIDDFHSRWNIGLGPIRLSKSVSTQTFAKVFVSFNLLLWVTGAALILLGDNLGELGTAIVVGATFSFSAFLTEVWSQGMNRRAEVDKSYLSRLNEQRNGVLHQLDQQSDSATDSPDRTEGGTL